jgi:hypothetical protein
VSETTEEPEAPKSPEGEQAIVESEWWRRAWAERVAALEEAYGKSTPPGAPPGTLLELPPELRGKDQFPGGRLAIFPPDRTKKRDFWLFSTIGLSQPNVEPTEKIDPENPAASRLGFEVAIAVSELAPWPFLALCSLAKVVLSPPAPVKIGTRIPFLFTKPKGSGPDEELVPCIGQMPANHDVVGEITSAILWPGLDRDGPFVTSTGRFDLLIATTITMDEWEMAKEMSSGHVLLLLRDAGIGQTSDPQRRTIVTNEVWKKAWENRIKKLTREGVLDKLYGPA